VWSRHVLACEPCAARLAERRRAAAAVSAALGAIQLPKGFRTVSETMAAAGSRRPRVAARSTAASRHALGAAAVVVVLLLPLLLVSPARAAVVGWLQQGWSQLARALGSGGAPPLSPRPARPAAAAPTYAVSFTPVASELSITVVERQRAGRIAVNATSGPEATVEVHGGAEESPLVTDAGLRILNAASSTATYEIALPATVRRVVVRVGDEPAVELSAGQVATGWSRDFAR
jgi:hypothetical protein